MDNIQHLTSAALSLALKLLQAKDRIADLVRQNEILTKQRDRANKRTADLDANYMESLKKLQKQLEQAVDEAFDDGKREGRIDASTDRMNRAPKSIAPEVTPFGIIYPNKLLSSIAGATNVTWTNEPYGTTREVIVAAVEHAKWLVKSEDAQKDFNTAFEEDAAFAARAVDWFLTRFSAAVKPAKE
jgi:flagellar hook-associated protein FlgK